MESPWRTTPDPPAPPPPAPRPDGRGALVLRAYRRVCQCEEAEEVVVERLLFALHQPPAVCAPGDVLDVGEDDPCQPLGIHGRAVAQFDPAKAGEGPGVEALTELESKGDQNLEAHGNHRMICSRY